MATTVYVQSPGMSQMQPTSGNVIVPSMDPTIAETYMSRQSKHLGIALVVIGSLAFIANGVGFALHDMVASLGHGFWCGILFIITGGFGIGAESKKRCLINTFLVLGTFSAVATVFLFFIALGGTSANGTCWSSSCRYSTVNVLIEAFQATLAVAASIVIIWGLVICCVAVCCCRPTLVATSYGTRTMFVSQQPGTVQYGNQQLITVPMSPPIYQMQPIPGGYPQPQQQYMPSDPYQPHQQYVQSGPYQPQYGYNAAASAPPSDAQSASAAMSAPPPYADYSNQKEFVH